MSEQNSDSPILPDNAVIQVPDMQLDTSELTAAQALHEIGGTDLGVWEIRPGVDHDVEAEEVFVVLSGRATVEIEGGQTLELSPGSVGAFAQGAKTTWTVHETLRKIYIIA